MLRGPQGTLFGRNTSAGLISVITAKPRFHAEVSGQVDIGNYNLRRFEASITGPLSDTIAARLDGVYVKRDGFLKDVISGRRLNDRDRWMLRGQLLFQPSDNFSFRLIGDYSKRNEECCAASFLPAHGRHRGRRRNPRRSPRSNAASAGSSTTIRSTADVDHAGPRLPLRCQGLGRFGRGSSTISAGPN